MGRNPLLAFLDTSKKPPRNPGINGVTEHDVTHSDPIMEFYEGDNNSYRGTEMHGVRSDTHATSFDPGDTQQDHTVATVETMPTPVAPDPIDVKIVNEFPQEQNRFRGYSFLVQSRAQQIVAAHPKRIRTTIRNIAQTIASTGTLPSNIFLSSPAGQTIAGNGATVNLPITNWTGLMVTYTVTALVLGAATEVRMKLQQTTDGVNWVDVPNSEKIFTAVGTQTAFINGPVSSRVRLAWTVTNPPATSFDATANVILFPIDVSDTTTGNDVFIGHDATVSPNPASNYRLVPGQEMVLSTETEIYAVCAAGLSSTLEIIEEYTVQLPSIPKK